MDFSLNKYQKELKEKALKFARKNLNGDVIQRDKDNEFSMDIWKACADFGLQGMPVPRKYSGMNLNIVDILAVLEGIGYGGRDNGMVFSINAHVCGCEIPVLNFGDEGQKKRYLPGLCGGGLIGAFAMTEPEAGSDVLGIRTKAHRDGNYYVLNGAKTFVTNAPIADIILVFVNTGERKNMGGISCLIAEKGTSGLSVGKNIDKSGLRTSTASDLIFEDCRIHKSNLLGKEGLGALVFNTSMEWERICMMANIVGAMDRQIECCLRYTKERKQFGKPINKFQSVSNKIVDMKARLEAGRLMLYWAGWLKRTGKHPLLEAAMTKLYISESYIQNCLNAIQIFGAYGYTVEFEFERELRDALASTIYSGTSEIQRSIISGLMGI